MTKLKVNDSPAWAYPDAGSYQAVFVDVYEKDSTFRGEPTTRLHFVWEINEANPDSPEGKPFLVFQSYNAYLSQTSKLGLMVSDFLGIPLTPESEIDFDDFMGQSCILNVSISPNERKPDQPWVNVAAVAPLTKGMDPLKASGHYVRRKDRDDYEGTEAEQKAKYDGNQDVPDPDELPFDKEPLTNEIG